jgi:broad specificity phosphatase PhoE
MAEQDKVYRYIMWVRHGQRKDHKPDVYPEFVGNPDSPLTPLAYEQGTCVGQECARRIASIAKEHGIDDYEVSMETSPFTRCLETAYYMAKELNINRCSFNYTMSEFLSTRFFKENPRGSLHTLHKSFEEISADFPGMTFEEDKYGRREMFGAVFPEVAEDAFNRFCVGHQDFVEATKKQTAKLHFCIVVSHGLQQQVIPQKYRDHFERNTCYCALTIAKMDNQGGDECVLERYEEHMLSQEKFKDNLFTPSSTSRNKA